MTCSRSADDGRRHYFGPAVILITTALLVIVTGPKLAERIAWAQADAQIVAVKNRLSSNPSLAELSESFREVAQAVAPSVVHIRVFVKDSERGRRRHSEEEELLRKFFRRGPWPDPHDDDEQWPDDDKGSDRYSVPRPSGTGSGWVYDDDGHIVTNYHVIEDADVISVRFQDGTKRDAKVIGTDPKTDIAVIQVDPGHVHPATIADEVVEQGDIVFAFGSPFRFEFSMSQGIVSGKGRRLGILSRRQGYENFIQTDAAINPGNSGGPLTNIYGQVVGMNTAIATRTGVYNGLGFAIPVKMVNDVVTQLIRSGRVSRGYLGIFIADLDPKLAETFGYDGDGVLVENPIDGGPAKEAGIERGDIITRINGEVVDNADALRRTVASFAPGTDLDVQIYRNGEYENFVITIGELPERVASAGEHPGSSKPDSDEQDARGAEILKQLGLESAVTFTQPLAERLGIDFEPGVILRRVRGDSVAASVGLTAKDIITDVMGVSVKSVTELVEQLETHDLAKGVRISVLQDGMPRYVLLEVPDE